MLKNIDWKNVGWRSLQVLIIAILNCFGIAMFIIMCIYSDNGEVGNWFFSENGIKFPWYIILIEVIGALLSVAFIKFLYMQNRQDKRVKEQTKELKDEQREEKDINKYL